MKITICSRPAFYSFTPVYQAYYNLNLTLSKSKLVINTIRAFYWICLTFSFPFYLFFHLYFLIPPLPFICFYYSLFPSPAFSPLFQISIFVYEYGKTCDSVALIATFWVTPPLPEKKKKKKISLNSEHMWVVLWCGCNDQREASTALTCHWWRRTCWLSCLTSLDVNSQLV